MQVRNQADRCTITKNLSILCLPTRSSSAATRDNRAHVCPLPWLVISQESSKMDTATCLNHETIYRFSQYTPTNLFLSRNPLVLNPSQNQRRKPTTWYPCASLTMGTYPGRCSSSLTPSCDAHFSWDLSNSPYYSFSGASEVQRFFSSDVRHSFPDSKTPHPPSRTDVSPLVAVDTLLHLEHRCSQTGHQLLDLQLVTTLSFVRIVSKEAN